MLQFLLLQKKLESHINLITFFYMDKSRNLTLLHTSLLKSGISYLNFSPPVAFQSTVFKNLRLNQKSVQLSLDIDYCSLLIA
jgi:hypothetical protein